MRATAWAKLDDRFHTHPKVVDAWQRDPVAIGLYMMSLSWVATGWGTMLNAEGHEGDGYVTPTYVMLLMPDREKRASAVSTLVDCGLWEADPDSGWWIHDYLDYNPSREEREAKRKTNAERVRRHREKAA